MDGISRSRGCDKEIPHGVLPMEQLVLSDTWVRIIYPIITIMIESYMLQLLLFVLQKGWATGP